MNTVDFEATKPETFVGKTLPELVDALYPNIELNVIAPYKGVDVMADLSKSAKKWPEIATLPLQQLTLYPAIHTKTRKSATTSSNTTSLLRLTMLKNKIVLKNNTLCQRQI